MFAVSHLFQFVFGNRRLMLALALAICGLGIFALRQLPIDAVPDITNVQVMVNSKTGSLSPEQIERQVTFPIESELNGIPGVSEIRSLSKFGLSQVVVVFQSSVDIYWARSQIFERLQAVELPTGIVAELAPITTGLGEVVMYTVEAKEGSALWKMPDMQRLIRLREIQERIIRPEMRRIEGVADVDTNGGYRKEVHINVLPSKLREHGMTILDLKHAVDTIGENVGGGYIQGRFPNHRRRLGGCRQSLGSRKFSGEGRIWRPYDSTKRRRRNSNRVRTPSWSRDRKRSRICFGNHPDALGR